MAITLTTVDTSETTTSTIKDGFDTVNSNNSIVEGEVNNNSSTITDHINNFNNPHGVALSNIILDGSLGQSSDDTINMGGNVYFNSIALFSNEVVVPDLNAGATSGIRIIDWNLGNKQVLSLDENISAMVLTPPSSGVGMLQLRVIQPPAATYSITAPAWGSQGFVRWPEGKKYAPTLVAGAIDILTFFYAGGTNGFDNTHYYATYTNNFS